MLPCLRARLARFGARRRSPPPHLVAAPRWLGRPVRAPSAFAAHRIDEVPFMTRHHLFSRRALAASFALTMAGLCAQRVHAQAAPAPAAASSAAAPTALQRVTVTGNPLGSQDIAAPVSVLSGDALTLRRGSSLGETLSGLPGVASTYFGPNANRPTIRGLDGDRVKVLSNAGASLDASSLSFDHAVPIDPLIVDRIEVLRGPGALFYGGSAVGGVVNTLDNRIPRERLNGLGGSAELRFGGADAERGGAAVIEAGSGDMAWHADVFGRNTSDLRVPRYTPVAEGQALPEATRVRNSASETRGGAAGVSYFFGASRVGLALDRYDSNYGTVAEPDVTIQMKRSHLGIAGEFKDLNGPFSTLRTTFNRTRYQHQEVDGSGAIGTTFKTAGDEFRAEAEHRPFGTLKGVLSLQLESFDFSALGDEAFVPSTRTRKQALFALEETPWPLGTLSFGGRIERVQVASDGDADPASAKFGAPAQRRFSLASASVSNVYKLDAAWALTGSVSATERAPTSFELFANGLHAATGAFEVGDASLGKERGHNLDLALQWRSGSNHLRAGVFATRFSRFISLESAGKSTEGEGAAAQVFPRYEFRAVRARLNGVEVDGQYRLLDAGWTLDTTGKLDLTRAVNADTGEPLPRVAPLRITLGLDAAHGAWAARAEVDHAERQARVPAADTPTAGYTLVNLSLSRSFLLDRLGALWFLKLTNIGDALAYSASSVDTIRGLAPLPGRGLKTGVRLSF